MRSIELLRAPIEHAYSNALAARVINILKDMDINYVEQLETTNRMKIYQRRNFGDKAMEALITALAEFDIEMEGPPQDSLIHPHDNTYEQNILMEKGVLRRIPAPKLRSLVTVAEDVIEKHPKMYSNIQFDSIKAAVYDAKKILAQPIVDPFVDEKAYERGTEED